MGEEGYGGLDPVVERGKAVGVGGGGGGTGGGEGGGRVITPSLLGTMHRLYIICGVLFYCASWAPNCYPISTHYTPRNRKICRTT